MANNEEKNTAIDTTLILFFPCEYQFKNKKKPFPYDLNMKAKREKIDKSRIPFIEIVKAEERPSSIKKWRKKIITADWANASTVFTSCEIDEKKINDALIKNGYVDAQINTVLPKSFRYESFYPSAGISISCKPDSISLAKDFLKTIYALYRQNNPELAIITDNSESNNKSIWQIYNMPIAWIQSGKIAQNGPENANQKTNHKATDNTSEQTTHNAAENTAKSTTEILTEGIDDKLGIVTIYSQPIDMSDQNSENSITDSQSQKNDNTACKKSNISSYEYIILLNLLLSTYGNQTIQKMKRELSSTSKKPVKESNLRKIHDSCALFSNLYYHPFPCRSNTEQDMYIKMKRLLRLDRVNRQMKNAKELLDYRNELNMSTKSGSIETTLFFTGYIGVLFSLLAFCKIQGTDIVDYIRPTMSGWEYCLFATLVCLFFMILAKVYSYISGKHTSRIVVFFIWLGISLCIGMLCYAIFFWRCPLFVISH